MMSKHKNLVGLEETRLLRDFEKYGYDPQAYYSEFYDGEFGEEDHAHDGWIMFSPKDANQILEALDSDPYGIVETKAAKNDTELDFSVKGWGFTEEADAISDSDAAS